MQQTGHHSLQQVAAADNHYNNPADHSHTLMYLWQRSLPVKFAVHKHPNFCLIIKVNET
jgi:hypothetical protein